MTCVGRLRRKNGKKGGLCDPVNSPISAISAGKVQISPYLFIYLFFNLNFSSFMVYRVSFEVTISLTNHVGGSS